MRLSLKRSQKGLYLFEVNKIYMKDCKCGCGQQVSGKRVFVNKEHQLTWMAKGGAKELCSLQPLEAKIRGGAAAGRQTVLSGRQPDMARKAAEKSREIAEQFRQKH
jgi:hypothetical protein